MAVVPQGGKEAVTHWRVEERFTRGALLELQLETGRTHQIRVHLKHEGTPLVADPVYGSTPQGLPKALADAIKQFGRQALHAKSLEFDHPTTGERMSFESHVPEDFSRLLAHFRSPPD